MKKFFLIPLLTLMCSVMAWGTTRQVGTLSALNTALSNSSAGDVIKLTTDIDGSSDEYLVDWSAEDVILDLNGCRLRNTYAYGYATALHATVPMQIINSSATKAGTISCPNCAIYVDEGAVVVNGNVDFTGYVWLNDGWGEASLTFASDYSGIVTSDDVTAPSDYIHYILEDGCQGKFSSAFKTAVQSSLAEGQSFEQDGNYWVLSAGEVSVAQIGSTTYPTLAAAVAAATSGQTITLLEDVAEEVTINKSVTLAGNKSISKPLHLVGDITLTMAGVTIDAAGYSYGIRLDGNNNTYVINLANGSTNTVAGIDGIGGFNSNPTLTISGNGTLNINAQTTFANMVSATISAANLKANISGGSYGKIADHVTTLSLQAGQYSKQPTADQIAEGYSAIKVVSTGYYSVVDNSTVVAIYKDDLFSSLADALNAASADAMANVTLVKNVNESITINKNTVIYTSGYSVANSVAAGSGYTRLQNEMFGDVVLFLQNDLAAFIGLENYTFTPAADLDLSELGGYIPVWGNKTLILNEGITLTLKYAGNYPTLAVQNGATFTIKGKGTITTDKDAIKVENGGTLIIGEENSEDQVNITTSVKRQCNFAIRNAGQTTIYNVNIDGMSGAILNSTNGKVDIKGGRFVGHSTSNDVEGYGWTYAINNCGNMTMKNAYVQGVHGAVACRESKGTLELQNCDIRALNENDGVVHYALYVSTNAMVSAYNTKFYSENANQTIYVGDDDVNNTFGLIYLYDGCKTNRKLFVQQKRGQDNDLLFPVLLSEESAWYKVALRADGYAGNDDRLLPANIEYQAINEVIDGLTYSFGTHSTATDQKEIDSNEATIPWQQTTTWSDDEVPETTTAVVIPAGKVVVVSNDPEITGTGANKDTAAVAEQIFIGDGAKLTVQTGTTLNVGEGGVNIANGGQIVVEPGAVVTVGSAGLVTTEEEALVIEATEEDQGVFLLQPAVTENTQPKATVKLVAKAKQVGANEFIWERFAIPTVDGNATIYGNEGLDTVHYYGGGTSLQEGLYEWDGNNWAGVSSWKHLQPFKGYQLTNNSMYGNVVYTFEGNLVGNADQNFSFAQAGFGFFGNSYTGDIDIMKFFESFGSDMQKTIWIYDYYTDGFKAITETSYGSVYYGKRNARHGLITDIRSMQAFLMNTFATDPSAQNVDYSSAIWGNPKYGLVPTPTPAPKRVAANNEDMFTVYVAGAKQEDEVTFIRNNAYSAAFDNGADASKWMNNGLNLYVVTEDGELASVASDEIVDMTIAFQSGNETEYTLGFDNLRGEQFELRDVLTGATIQMTEGATYAFSQEANTTVPARFQIIGAKKVPTGVENVAEGANVQQKIMVNGVLYILRDNKWYNAQGQIVK